MNRRFLLAVPLAALAFSGCGASQPDSPSPASPSAERSHLPPATPRTVLVVDGPEPSPSRPGGPLHARLERGRMPAGQARGTVTSDENCQPDRHGVSHCINRVTLTDGTRLVLRHPHDMHQVPCLVPGEPVVLAANPS